MGDENMLAKNNNPVLRGRHKMDNEFTPICLLVWDGDKSWGYLKQRFLDGDPIEGKTIKDFKIGDVVKLKAKRASITLRLRSEHFENL